MEVDNQNPSEINSYLVNNSTKTNTIELSKKRKLQMEHIVLPLPKHICFNHTGLSSSASPCNKSDRSETESRKGSNNFFTGESENSISSSSSSTNLGSFSFKKTYDSLEITREMKDESSSSSGGDCNDNQKGSIAEYQNHLEVICSEYGIGNLEEYADKDVEDILYSNNDAQNPNTYVLSSGRWSVNQDSQQGTRKATIDQEFEHHFSMLML